MVSRKISVAVIVFGIAFASAIAGAREGRGKDKDDDDKNTDDARISQGFEIAPVALHFKKKDRDLVGLGSYIVNAQGACNDCHTNPPFATGGDPNAQRFEVEGVVASGITDDRQRSRQALIAKGHKLRASGGWTQGSNAGIIIDPKTGILSAGADPRVEAYAWAW